MSFRMQQSEKESLRFQNNHFASLEMTLVFK